MIVGDHKSKNLVIFTWSSGTSNIQFRSFAQGLARSLFERLSTSDVCLPKADAFRFWANSFADSIGPWRGWTRSHVWKLAPSFFLSNGFREQTDFEIDTANIVASSYFRTRDLPVSFFCYTSSDLHGWNLQKPSKTYGKIQPAHPPLEPWWKRNDLQSQRPGAWKICLVMDRRSKSSQFRRDLDEPVSLWRPCWNTETERNLCTILVWNHNHQEVCQEIQWEDGQDRGGTSCQDFELHAEMLLFYVYIYIHTYFFAIVAAWLLRGVHRFASFRGGNSWEIHGAFKLISNPEDSGRWRSC